MANKIIIEEELEDDSILIFKLSEQVSDAFIFSNIEFSTMSEPAREGILYAGPSSSHDAPDEIKRIVDPFYNIRGLTDIQIDGNKISFFRDREADPYDATQDVVNCIVAVMGWQKDDTEVVHKLTSFLALLHKYEINPYKGRG